jgi:hypothetical protein
VVVSQAAALRVKARKSNMIKTFIEFILNDLLCFAYSHMDDKELKGIETGKILDFGPTRVGAKRSRRQVFAPRSIPSKMGTPDSRVSLLQALAAAARSASTRA